MNLSKNQILKQWVMNGLSGDLEPVIGDDLTEQLSFSNVLNGQEPANPQTRPVILDAARTARRLGLKFNMDDEIATVILRQYLTSRGRVKQFDHRLQLTIPEEYALKSPDELRTIIDNYQGEGQHRNIPSTGNQIKVLSVTDDQYNKLTAIGDGNASLGFRALINDLEGSDTTTVTATIPRDHHDWVTKHWGTVEAYIAAGYDQ